MAFFKLRKGGDDQTAVVAPPESIEALRKRAKHRLIGSVVLVLVAVVGFPLLVDKQPRPMAVDIAIDIPDKAKVKPLSMPAPAETPVPTSLPAPVAPTPAAVVPVPAAATVVKASPAPVAASAVAPVAAKVADKPADKASSKPVDKPTQKSTDKAVDKATDKASDKSADKPADKLQVAADNAEKADAKTTIADEGRYVVQVGAFAEEARARTARQKLERAGFKNYTQVVDTKDGKRIRVRAGPFVTKAAADKAAEKIKKLGLPTSVLTL